MNIEALLAEVRALRLDLAGLSARVLALEEARERAAETPGSNPTTVVYTEPGPSSGLSFGTTPVGESVQSPVAPAGNRSTLGGGRVGAAYYTDAERRAIAVAAGGFIRRSLNGDHRGTSGRENLRLQSRIYLLFRDHSGNIYNPVRIFETLASLNPLIRPRGELGDSVFIGFPTRWEGRVCAEAAGVTWPVNG